MRKSDNTEPIGRSGPSSGLFFQFALETTSRRGEVVPNSVRST